MTNPSGDKKNPAKAKAPRCVLICTHQAVSGREGPFLRFLETARKQELPPGIELFVSVLLQGCDEIPEKIAAQIGDDPRIHIVFSPGLVPASRARNLALAAADIADKDIVHFPDDDCWYPRGALRHLVETMRKRGSELVFVWYHDPPLSGDALRRAVFEHPTPTEVMRRTAMSTIVMSGRVVRAIGNLDERIGLGTDLSGGEDADYAYRAYKVARTPLMTRAALIGHRPLADTWSTRIAAMPRYWPGLMFQTLKHLEPGLIPLTLYRCCVGIILAALRRITLSDLLRPFSRWIGDRRVDSRPAEGVRT